MGRNGFQCVKFYRFCIKSVLWARKLRLRASLPGGCSCCAGVSELELPPGLPPAFGAESLLWKAVHTQGNGFSREAAFFFSQFLVCLKGIPGTGEVTLMNYEVIPNHAFFIRRRQQCGGQVCLKGQDCLGSYPDSIICDLELTNPSAPRFL